jgi:hypothetical protein
MLRKFAAFIGLAGLVALSATPATIRYVNQMVGVTPALASGNATQITSASVTPTCTGYTITLNAWGLPPGQAYSFTWEFFWLPRRPGGCDRF